MTNDVERKRVCIQTWYYYPNPGTAFQAYALQNYIDSLPQFQAEILNMYNSKNARKNGRNKIHGETRLGIVGRSLDLPA